MTRQEADNIYDWIMTNIIVPMGYTDESTVEYGRYILRNKIDELENIIYSKVVDKS